MRNELFDLDFSRGDVVLISLLPAVINIAIYMYTTAFFYKSRLNAFFSLFTLMLGLWQMADAFVRLSKTIQAANDWDRLALVFLLFAISFGLEFVLTITRWRKKVQGNYLSTILILPTVVFFLILESGEQINSVVHSENWHWVANPVFSVISVITYLWVIVGASAMVVILWYFFFKTEKDDTNRKLILLLAIGISVPISIGIVIEGVLPMFFGFNDIPVSAPLTCFFSVLSLVAITRYRLFDFSPRHQWQQIVTSMNEGILIVNNEDKIMYANDFFCKMIGYTLEEIKGRISRELLLDPSGQKKMERIIEDRKNNQSGQYQISMRSRSGREICMWVSGSPYRDQKGNVIGSIGLHTDITPIVVTTQQLRDNESRLKDAQAIAHFGNWLLDFMTGKAIWSEEACRIYEIPQELSSYQTLESWLGFVHSDDLSKVKSKIQSLEASGAEQLFEHRINCPNGKIKHIETVIKSHQLNGKVIGMVGICHDITEQKSGEQERLAILQESRSFIDESLLSIFFFDPVQMKILYANRAFYTLTGHAPEELESINVMKLVQFSKEDFQERIDYVLAKNKSLESDRVWQRKDGQMVHVNVSRLRMKRDGKDVIYIAAEDINEQKKAELDLKALNKELETFIYKISHDIRGPLATIMGLTYIVRNKFNNPEAETYLNMTESSAIKLDNILVEFVKAMEINKITDFNEVIDFKLLIDDILKISKYAEMYNHVKVITNVATVEHVHSNAFLYKTIIGNLVNNSLVFHSRGISSPYVNVTITVHQHEIHIQVQDNGMGIRQSLTHRVFDMYFRGSKYSAGAGLGLYLVKKAVDKLNGTIELNSKEGVGTHVSITLPLVPRSNPNPIHQPAMNG